MPSGLPVYNNGIESDVYKSSTPSRDTDVYTDFHHPPYHLNGYGGGVDGVESYDIGYQSYFDEQMRKWFGFSFK